MLRYVTLRCGKLRYVMLRYVRLRDVALRYVTLRYVKLQIEARIKYHQVVLLPDSTNEADPSVSGLSVDSNRSSFVRHQSGGLLQRITSGSTSEANGSTTGSLTQSPACCFVFLALTSTYARTEIGFAGCVCQSEWHSSCVPRCTSACTEWPPATSTSCAFLCTPTPVEVVFDRLTERRWRPHDTNYQRMVHERSASLDQLSGTLSLSCHLPDGRGESSQEHLRLICSAYHTIYSALKWPVGYERAWFKCHNYLLIYATLRYITLRYITLHFYLNWKRISNTIRSIRNIYKCKQKALTIWQLSSWWHLQ